MKRPTLAPRDRRALLLGALVLAPVLLVTAVVNPLLGTRNEIRRQLADQRNLLAGELALLQETDAYPRLMRQAENLMSSEMPRLFGGTDAAAATSSLADYVAAVGQRSGVLLQETTGQEAEPEAFGVVRLGVEVRGVGDLAGILLFLQSLEEGSKLVRVEALSIDRADQPGSAIAPEEEVLVLAATLSGFTVAAGDVSAPGSDAGRAD